VHESWSPLERDAFAVDEPAMDVLGGAAGAVATTAPLALGLVLDQPAAGLAAALGGLYGSLGTPVRGPDRARWAAVAVIGTTVSMALGTALADATTALVIVTVVVTAATAELRRYGRSGAMCGFLHAATLIIAGGLPDASVAAQTVPFLVGALAGAGLMLAAGASRARPDHGVAPGAATGRDATRPPPASPIPPARLHAHAVRTSLAVGLALAGARAADLAFGYWVPLTTLAVLQPEPHASWVRMVQRTAGTLLGTLAVLGVTWWTTDPVVLIPVVAVCSLALFSLHDRSYYWFVLTLTPTVLLMISTDVPLGPEIAGDRLAATALGIAVAGAANAATVAWLRATGAGRDEPSPEAPTAPGPSTG
jgi:hypothetical protein